MYDSDDLRTKQDAMLDFYAHHALTVGFSPGWLHVQLYAIRHYHLLADIDVDLRIMLRLTLAKKGWKRLHGSEQRKIAVTVVEILADRTVGQLWSEPVYLGWPYSGHGHLYGLSLSVKV